MQQPPYMPPPPQKRFPWPWFILGIAVVVTALVVGYLVANLAAKPKAAPPVIVIQSPSPAPSSPVPLPEPDPVIVDPMDDAIIELHGVVYVQQFCNMVDRSGIDDFAQLIDIGKPWRTNSIGSAWVAAQNRTGYPISKLATEFYSRYC